MFHTLTGEQQVCRSNSLVCCSAEWPLLSALALELLTCIPHYYIFFLVSPPPLARIVCLLVGADHKPSNLQILYIELPIGKMQDIHNTRGFIIWKKKTHEFHSPRNRLIVTACTGLALNDTFDSKIKGGQVRPIRLTQEIVAGFPLWHSIRSVYAYIWQTRKKQPLRYKMKPISIVVYRLQTRNKYPFTYIKWNPISQLLLPYISHENKDSC